MEPWPGENVGGKGNTKNKGYYTVVDMIRMRKNKGYTSGRKLVGDLR